MNITKMTFDYNKSYSRTEIEQMSGNVELDDTGGETYLIAMADREYWFVPTRVDDKWMIAFTWSSFYLAEKEIE